MRKSIMGMVFLLFIMGLLMVLSPATWLKIMVILLGIFALGNGMYNILYIRSKIINDMVKRLTIIRATVSICVGFAAIILPLFLAELIWTIMLYILAAYLLLSAISELISARELKLVGISSKAVSIEVVTSIVLSILLFALPGEIALVFVRVIGSILLGMSVILSIWEWKSKPTKIEVEEVN